MSSSSSTTSSSSKHLKQVSCLNPALPSLIPSLRALYQSSKPYQHCVIPNLCVDAHAREMLEEIKALQGRLKETDLFKVYQTGDLANADDNDPEHQAKLPLLLQLRRELNSPEFKEMIQAITGCGPLSSTVDLSANIYAKGGHLLCHDDVISTRKVSYIVYLGEPDEGWKDEDGGRLELYASDGMVPDPEPCVRLLPLFNHMALFVVEPGVSFHSVEEVRAEGKPRVSLQGWFHAPAAPPQADKASLSQLMRGQAHDAPFEEVGARGGELSAADVAELREWVNPTFLSEQALDQILKKCETADACVSLVKFLRADVAEGLRRALDLRGKPGPGWTVVGPAHMQRYLQLDKQATKGPLGELVRKMASPVFTRFLERVTGLRLSHRKQLVRRFRKGSDYTVATAACEQERELLDVTLCLVEDDDVWGSGDVGGFDSYVDREEDDTGDVAVYELDQGGGGVVQIDPGLATLAIVWRDSTRMHFIKYLSHEAPSDRVDIAQVYKCAEEQDEEEGEQEEERN